MTDEQINEIVTAVVEAFSREIDARVRALLDEEFSHYLLVHGVE